MTPAELIAALIRKPHGRWSFDDVMWLLRVAKAAVAFDAEGPKVLPRPFTDEEKARVELRAAIGGEKGEG